MIPKSKDNTLSFTLLTKTVAPVHVYSDGSGYEGGIGTSTIFYIKGWLVKTLCYYLGTKSDHTVYEAEGVGLVMGLHLLKNLSFKLSHPTIGADSQAVLRALDNQWSHLGHYILDCIHSTAENLHMTA